MIGTTIPDGGDSAALDLLAATLRDIAADAPASLGGEMLHGEILRDEILDILAVWAGCKPAAVVGYCGAPAALLAAIADTVGEFGLATLACTAWTSRGELDGVPIWFAEAVADARKRTPLLGVSLLPDRMHALHGNRAATLAPFTETALLGYPACCTGHHATWRAAVHRRIAEETLAAARSDHGRAQRMAAAGWTPTRVLGRPLDALLDRATAPHTSIVMCPDCEDLPMSPARQISATQADLAKRFALYVPSFDRPGHDRAAPLAPAGGHRSRCLASEASTR